MHLKLLIALFLIGCLPCTAQLSQVNLNTNETSATINTRGLLFHSISGAPLSVLPGYSIRHKNKHLPTIYSGGLWISAADSSGKIYTAAIRSIFLGHEFGPGPSSLSTAADAAAYDTLYSVSQEDILAHKKDPINTTWDIINWPGNGDTTLGEPWQLAPFVDLNNNQKYEPTLGEYPLIKGIAAVYCIYNDSNTNHKNTRSDAMNIDVHQLFYQDTITLGNQTIKDLTLARFIIVNRGIIDLHNFRLGINLNYSLGNFADDYVGCDPRISFSFAYNGDDYDEGPSGFEDLPPAQGITFLNHTMGAHLAYQQNALPINGNPDSKGSYYNYMNGLWQNGSPIFFGGDGLSTLGDTTTYMYAFSNDPNVPNDNWSEATANNTPGSRATISATSPIVLHSGGMEVYDIAFVFSKGTPNDAEEAISSLAQKTRLIRFAYQNDISRWKKQTDLGANIPSTLDVKPITKQSHLSVFPNPAYGYLHLVTHLRDLPISLYTMQGKHIKSFEENTSRLALYDLCAGIYQLRVGTHTVRIIKL